MRKTILIAFLASFLASCAPNIYQVYEQYRQDPKFEHTKVDGSLLQLGSFLISDEQKEIRSLLESINTIDIVNYKGNDNFAFQNAILKSLKASGYREVLKDKKAEMGATFFVKKGLTRVREFHVLNYEGGNVSVFSINGKFNIFNLEKIYKLVKKQDKMRNLIDNFNLKKVFSE